MRTIYDSGLKSLKCDGCGSLCSVEHIADPEYVPPLVISIWGTLDSSRLERASSILNVSNESVRFVPVLRLRGHEVQILVCGPSP